MVDKHSRGVPSDVTAFETVNETDRSPTMGNKNKGGREAKKPKKSAKAKAPVTSTIIPPPARPADPPKPA
jgi:hypothetical protein